MSESTHNILNSNRIAKNTLFLYIRMLFSLLVSLYTSRVVLHTLGVVDYGIYNVVGGFVALFGTLNTSLSASMQRFYNYYIGQESTDGVVRTYRTGRIIHLVFIVIVALVLEPLGIWYVNHILVLPADRLLATNILLQSTIVSLLILIIQIPYISLVLAYEKMDFYALLSIASVVLRLLLVICLPHIPYDKLMVFAGINLILAVFELAMYYIFCRRHMPFVFLSKPPVERVLLRDLLSFSGWNVVGTFAYILKYEGVNMFLNFFFGPIVNAARGIAYQVQNAIQNFAGNISTAFRPQIVNAHAAHNEQHVVKLFFAETKALYILMLTIIMPLIFEMDCVLHLWLGDIVPDRSTVFTILVLADVLVTVINQPCNHIVFATGNITAYQIVSSVISVLLLPVAWVGLHFGCDATYVFVVLIGFSILNQAACVYLANRHISFGIWLYIKCIVIRYLLCIAINIAALYAVTTLVETSYWRLLLTCTVSVLLNALLGYTIVFNRDERTHLLLLLKKALPHAKQNQP